MSKPGTPPVGYVCRRCGEQGHYKNNCPKGAGPDVLGADGTAASKVWNCCRWSLQFAVLLLAVFVGYLIGTSPVGVTPPLMPTTGFSAVMEDVPPWPVFRVAVALNSFFKQAAQMTTLPKVQVIEQATGYWRSTIISGITTHRIVETLNEAGANGMTCEQVAIKRHMHAPHLCRILEAATQMNLLFKDRLTGKLTPTAAGKLLNHDIEGSIAPFVEMITSEAAPAWNSVMTHSIQSPTSGWEVAFPSPNFAELGPWEWYAEHPVEEARFGQAMMAFTKASAGSILADYPFPVSDDAVVCDIGGGIGHTLKMILDHYPSLKGLLFDRPGVADSEDAKANFHGRAGVKFVADWDDATSIEILKNIASTAKRGAKLAVAEHVLGTQVADMELSKTLMDINMMACNPVGACERSVSQYEVMFRKAGITGEVNYIPLRDIIGIVEVRL